MGKTLKKDPYANVRREVPKSGWPIVHKKEFVRRWEKFKEEKEIEDGVEEYFGEKKWQNY